MIDKHVQFRSRCMVTSSATRNSDSATLPARLASPNPPGDLEQDLLALPVCLGGGGGRGEGTMDIQPQGNSCLRTCILHLHVSSPCRPDGAAEHPNTRPTYDHRREQGQSMCRMTSATHVHCRGSESMSTIITPTSHGIGSRERSI